MKRKSAALTFRWFTGLHTYNRITKVIRDVYIFHDLEFGKFVTRITDNASNFIKAFSEYMVVENDLELTGEVLKYG